MATAVKLLDTITYKTKIGRIAEENPDLTYEFIKNILITLEEKKENKLETYQFDAE